MIYNKGITMNLSIENAINTKLNTIFDELGLDFPFGEN